MKSILLTLMMLLISSVTFAADVNIDGRWSGVYPQIGTLIFEFRSEGKKLYGLDLSSGDKKVEIQKGKIKNDEISFEVPVTGGMSKMSIVYKGKILSDNEIELTFSQKARGRREPGFGAGGTGGFDSGFGGGLGGFGGASQESTKFTIKRVRNE